MAMDLEAEGGDIHLGRNDGPMPTDIKLVVRRENALVEHLPGGFQQGGPRPLQDHLPLLRKGRGQRSFARPAGQRQIRHRLRQGAMREQCRATQRSEEHTSELQSLLRISLAVFRLKKKRGRYMSSIVV